MAVFLFQTGIFFDTYASVNDFFDTYGCGGKERSYTDHRHNFVYKGNKLNGIIDPSPLIGPKIYDFTYAFCSSSDNLNLRTLLSPFSIIHTYRRLY